MREPKTVKVLGNEDRSVIQQYLQDMNVDVIMDSDMVIPITRTPIPEMTVYPYEKPIQLELVRTEPKIGRNQACPCGSGKKYKFCCLNKANTP